MHNSTIFIYRRCIELYLRIFFGCEIPSKVKIGKNCKFAHNGLGVVIHPEAVIGDNCKINQNVTIGGRSGYTVVPKIGNNVEIGAGAIIIGPITIGDNVKIGAGAIVVKNVPDNAVVRSKPSDIYLS